MRTYVRLGLVGALVAGFAVGAVAQGPPNAPPPAGQAGPQGPMERRMMRQERQNPDRAAMMRAQIEERFGQAIRNQLGLNDQQMDRLRAATRANEDRHRDFNRREADMFRAAMEQMKPGVAARQDSLAHLLDGIAALRVQRAQSDQQELRELAQFLNPLQRVQLLMMRRNLMNRVQQIRRGAGMGMGAGMEGPGRPGMMTSPPARPDSQPGFDQ